MKTSLIVTVAALAVVAGGLALMRDRGSSASATTTDPKVGQPLLADDAVSKATTFKLAGSDRSVVVRRGENGEWTLPESHDLPADFDKLRRLVDELRQAKVSRFVTASADRLARLELGKSTLTLLGSEGAELATVRFGKASNGGGSFVAFGAEGPAYEIGSNPWIDTNPDGWSRKQVIEFQATDVLGVVFHNQDGSSLAVSRSESAEPWIVEGEEPVGGLRTNEVERFLGQLLNARFSTATALDHPDAVGALAAAVPYMELTLKDGAKVSVRIGRRLPTPPAEGEPAPDQPPGSGPVYLFYDLGDKAGPWAKPLATAGLQFYDYLWTGRPANRDAFGNPPPPPPATSASPEAPAADSPGTISVVTEPIEIPPYVPPAPATSPSAEGEPQP